MRAVSIVCLFVLLTVAMTYPQTKYISTHVPSSDDPLLSIWRLAWIAHVLPSNPTDLLNGNIFYPEKRTLAFTDAALLEGFVAAPMIWAGASPVTAYNLLLLAAIALSGAAMFLYAFRLTASPHAALLAGIAFAYVPFRYDHFHHLELQATMFLPLTLWWIERALESGDRRDVVGAAVSFVAQVYCGIYYSVFLATALVIILPLRLRSVSVDRRRALLSSGIAATIAAAIVILPYLAAYMSNRDMLGDRSEQDVRLYSAHLTDYLASPSDNVIHGWWGQEFGYHERRLFPGVIAVVLAVIGLIGFEKRRATIAIAGAVGFVLSLGINTPIYDVIRTVLFAYRGLRAPARASILVFLAIAGLAAFGWARVLPRLRRWQTPATAVVAVAMLLEYATLLHSWLPLPAKPIAVHAWLAEQPRSVVVEFPLPTADRLDHLHEGLYMLGSTIHWQPLLNGYSGFFPRSFLELTDVVKTFPDDRSVDYLKHRGVDLIVVHGSSMPPDTFGRISAGLLVRTDVETVARFAEPRGADMVFRLKK